LLTTALFLLSAGPVFGGFAAEALGYKWPLIELLILSGFTLVVLFFLLPETFGPTILLHRAQRLRKASGDDRYKSPSEITNEGKTIAQEVKHNFIYTLKLSMEPAILFSNVYIGLVYSVYDHCLLSPFPAS
jgi:DHA1 family multidrug resistance protein-like MFS transporter